MPKITTFGHSTGGGEVARYIRRRGTSRVAKAVVISAVPPLMLRTDHNPGGTPKEAFDQIRAAVLADRSQFIHGDDDQIVPICASALRAVELINGATLKVYPGGSHGICSTEKDKVNGDLLAFISRSNEAAA